MDSVLLRSLNKTGLEVKDDEGKYRGEVDRERR